MKGINGGQSGTSQHLGKHKFLRAGIAYPVGFVPDSPTSYVVGSNYFFYFLSLSTNKQSLCKTGDYSKL